MNLIKFRATKNDEGRTLFKYLIKQLNNVPLSVIEKLFRIKDIKVNGKRTNDKSYILKEEDKIFVYGVNETKIDNFIETKVEFKVIYEDKNILVIDKPINISMHGFSNCLDNQVLTYLQYKQKDSFKPSSIGRLDKHTSGLIVYAKTYKALVQLNEKINKHEKYYILKSDFDWSRKKVVLYQRKNPKTYELQAFDKEPGSRMETLFFKDNNKKYAMIFSGKKHQIRLSLKYFNFPIYGDKKYGGKFDKRLYLHSYKIIFHCLENELEYLNDTQFICDVKW